MRHATILSAIGVIAFVCVAHSNVVGASQPSQLSCNKNATSIPTELGATQVTPDPACDLRISNVRFEVPPPDAPLLSTLLKFDMSNEGAVRMTDVDIEVTISERVPRIDGINEMRLLVGPFTIRGHVTIEAGYTFNYNLLLRNLSSECGCVANVNVVSARLQPDAEM